MAVRVVIASHVVDPNAFFVIIVVLVVITFANVVVLTSMMFHSNFRFSCSFRYVFIRWNCAQVRSMILRILDASSR